MKHIRIVLSAIAGIMLFGIQAAHATGPDPIVYPCKVSPQIFSPIDPPESFPRSNNLRRKTGSPDTSNGVPMKIEGRLLDKNCTPVENATIYMWQTNENGHYQSYYANDDKSDPNFAGGGIAVTDNMGHFEFLTIEPEPYNDRAKQVHFIIRDRDVKKFETIMYFPFNPANMNDPQFLGLTPEQRRIAVAQQYTDTASPTFGENTYFFPITLPVKAKYRGF